MAATGCPVVNGDRWRGLLGVNDPDALGRLSTIPVPSGRPSASSTSRHVRIRPVRRASC